MMNKGKGRRAKSLCKACHNRNTIGRGRQNKLEYIEFMGGACQCCGYNACMDALDFHHKDPLEKDPSFRSFRYWGLEKAKKELEKCMLVCSNCHREIHAGFRKVPGK